MISCNPLKLLLPVEAKVSIVLSKAPETADNSASVAKPEASSPAIVVANEDDISSLLVCADPLNTESKATLCVCAEDDKEVSPAVYSVLNAVAVEDD